METNHTDTLSRKCRMIAENALECIWIYDTGAKQFTFVSPAIYRLTGYTVDEVMQNALPMTLTQDSRDEANRIIRLLKDRYAKGERREEALAYTGDFELLCKNKRKKQVEITAKLICNSESGSLEILGITLDITQRKQLEQQLKQALDNKNEMIQRLRDSEQSSKELAEELNQKNKILHSRAIRDSLTGIYNRYYFDKKLAEEVDRCQRYQHPLSIALIDIDGFKEINDTYGHQSGDHVLVSIADTVHKSIRKHDIFARWGGDEFVVLMPQTPLTDAATAAEKLRKKIETIQYAEIESAVSASFGVVEFLQGEAEESCFRRVDYALFQSKNAGRNCVTAISWEATVPYVQIKLEWKHEWECGNATIDGQHKKLLTLGNKLLYAALSDMQSQSTASVLDELAAHIQQHFESEEQILRSLAYPAVDEHAAIHTTLIHQTKELGKQYKDGKLTSSAIFSFLLDKVIMGHLLMEDILFFSHIKSHQPDS